MTMLMLIMIQGATHNLPQLGVLYSRPALATTYVLLSVLMKLYASRSKIVQTHTCVLHMYDQISS